MRQRDSKADLGVSLNKAPNARPDPTIVYL